MKETNLTTNLMAWMNILIRLSLHDLNHYARKVGLTLAQMNVLMHLNFQGSKEVNTFCEVMQISPAGASQMIERMVQQGVVQRKESPEDRRVRLVELTAQGEKIVAESIATRQEWVDQLVETLSAEERELVSKVLIILNKRAEQINISPL